MNTNQQNTNTYKEDEYSFSDLYLALANGIKWIVFTPIVLGLVTTLYLVFIAKPTYESTATLLPSIAESGNTSSLLSMASQFGISIPSQFEDTDFLSADMYPAIVKSRSLAKTILNRNFDTEENERLTLLSILTDPNEFENGDSSEVIANIIKYFSEEIVNISQDPNTPLYTLRVLTEDPLLSAQIANAVIEELDELQIEFRSQNVTQKREFVEDRIDDVKIELEKAETNIKIFREQNKQISYSPSLLLEQARLERETQVQTEIYISLKQQYETVKIEEVQESSFVQILDEPNIPIDPSGTRKLFILFFVGFGGFTLGILIAIFKESHRIQKSNNDSNYLEANKIIAKFFRLKK
jgi:uncharacterized protein involved in exopolysaccharide biosynthesis